LKGGESLLSVKHSTAYNFAKYIVKTELKNQNIDFDEKTLTEFTVLLIQSIKDNTNEKNEKALLYADKLAKTKTIH
jgi:hypothetical protein